MKIGCQVDESVQWWIGLYNEIHGCCLLWIRQDVLICKAGFNYSAKSVDETGVVRQVPRSKKGLCLKCSFQIQTFMLSRFSYSLLRAALCLVIELFSRQDSCCQFLFGSVKFCVDINEKGLNVGVVA